MVLQPGKAMEAAERGLVSIVKTSTMVLQHRLLLLRPHTHVSIVKTSTMVLQQDHHPRQPPIFVFQL